MKTQQHAILQKGYTIVELLITISVLGIIIAVIVVASVTVQRQSRDREREADVAAIMSALEKYYDTHGEYPAENTLNPNASSQRIDFGPVKALMPELTDDMLAGPGGYRFLPGCINSRCMSTSNDWREFQAKSYRYSSRDTSFQNPTTYYWVRVPASFGSNTGWGCEIQTTYANPGFVLAWRRESDGIWVFKRSQRGEVSIANYQTGPIAPQTCTFS